MPTTKTSGKKTAAKTQAKAKTKSKAKTQAKTKTQPQAKAKTKAQTKAQTKAKTKPKAKAKTQPKSKTAAAAKTQAKARPKTQPTKKSTATKSKPQPPKKKLTAKTSPAKPTAKKRATTTPTSSSTDLIYGVAPYKPKKNELYMGEPQLKHFHTILTNWKDELLDEANRTINHLQDEATNLPDSNDRATQEAEFGLELKTRDRERKLIRKIDSALERIAQGTYGYCEETGEEIGLSRLEARPIATLCLDAQERYERNERHFSDQ